MVAAARPNRMPMMRKSGAVRSVRSRNKPKSTPTRRLPTAESPRPVTRPIEEQSFRLVGGAIGRLPDGQESQANTAYQGPNSGRYRAGARTGLNLGGFCG